MSVSAPECARTLSLLFAAGHMFAYLFTNDHNPGPDDYPDGANYEDAEWTGYEGIEVQALGDPVEEQAEAYQDCIPLTWIPGPDAEGIAYGVYLWCDLLGGHLIDAQKLPMPVYIVPGEPITARPRFRVRALELEV